MWFEVKVEIDNKAWGSFITYAENDEKAIDDISCNEPRVPDCYKLNQLNYDVYVYSGNTEGLDKETYYQLED